MRYGADWTPKSRSIVPFPTMTRSSLTSRKPAEVMDTRDKRQNEKMIVEISRSLFMINTHPPKDEKVARSV